MRKRGVTPRASDRDRRARLLGAGQDKPEPDRDRARASHQRTAADLRCIKTAGRKPDLADDRQRRVYDDAASLDRAIDLEDGLLRSLALPDLRPDSSDDAANVLKSRRARGD